MKHCNITDQNREHHLKTIIKWLIEEVESAGGDGDGLWYSKYFSIHDIKQLIIKEDLLNNGARWTINEHDRSDAFFLEYDQASLLITNNETDVEDKPIWQQVTLIY